MTRAQQLERFLFSAKSAENGRVNISPPVVLDGLSHALGSGNPAVARAAALLLSNKLNPKAVQ
tara:strand:+ start:372 stop:560 length:189 start_codon:yes stop_codon:yes gene_type:complete